MKLRFQTCDWFFSLWVSSHTFTETEQTLKVGKVSRLCCGNMFIRKSLNIFHFSSRDGATTTMTAAPGINLSSFLSSSCVWSTSSLHPPESTLDESLYSLLFLMESRLQRRRIKASQPVTDWRWLLMGSDAPSPKASRKRSSPLAPKNRKPQGMNKRGEEARERRAQGK